MKVTELMIDNRSIGKKLLLVDVIPSYTYENGIRTDKIEGYRYVVAMADKAFDKISVKICGQKQMDKPEGYVEVAFDDLQLRIYWHAGTYDVGATATGIHPVTRENKATQ